MARCNFDNLESVIVNTGNILSINDITKKPNQNPSEELRDAINFTIREFQSENGVSIEPNHQVLVARHNDDLLLKLKDHDLSELKIGFKIFLNSDNQDSLCESIDKAFTILQVKTINDVIISFQQKQSEGKKENLEQIQTVWKELEKVVREEKIGQIGIADIEENTFRALYDWATVKPSIIQINLATCCVVPPTLQAFCKDNDIKLLTHSDPVDILPKQLIETTFGEQLNLKWALRFLIHVKCRGVLTTKGYLLSLSKN